MKMGSFPTMTLLALAGLCYSISAPAAAAQSSDDCRCVDRAGDEIENCNCFRIPSLESFGALYRFQDSRPRLGISVDAQQSARRDAIGALVTDVLDDGPADDAGIRRGDVITSVDGMSLFEAIPGEAEDGFDLDRSIPVQRLLAIAADLEPGQRVEVEYLRDDEARSVVVEAEDLSDSWGRNFTVVGPGWDTERMRIQLRSLTDGARTLEFRSRGLEDLTERLRDRDWNRSFELREPIEAPLLGRSEAPSLFFERLLGESDGLELIELNASLGSYFGAAEGVLVAEVEEESTLGLEPGDVVLRVGDRPVTTPDRMRRILRSYAEGEDVAFLIRRDGREMSVTGQVR